MLFWFLPDDAMYWLQERTGIMPAIAIVFWVEAHLWLAAFVAFSYL